MLDPQTMSNRIDQTFQRLRNQNQCAFIAYLTAGDPTPESTSKLVMALEGAGVDIIELGIPFSDPLADGEIIQAAANRAISSGTTVAGVLEIVRAVRRISQVPIVLFTYLNPIYAYGFKKFNIDAATAGADGLLILDLPPDETVVQNPELTSNHELLAIRLIAPTTPLDRIALIAPSAEGFIYYVSREGVTGEQTTLSRSISKQIQEIRRYTDLPIAVGFGISTPEQAVEVSRDADAVVVGSAIVRQIGEHGNTPGLAEAVARFVTPMVQAVKG